MKKINKTLIFLLAVIICSLTCQASPVVIRTDTIYRVDTITTKEVITRTEVIERSEKVVRYYDNGEITEQETTSSDIKGLSENVKAPEAQIEESKITPLIVEEAYEDSKAANETVPNYESIVETVFKKPVDINEKVIFRGDTINMILKDRNLGRYDRGLFNYLFIPKGIWQLGLTASYGEFSTSDLQILDLISDIDFNGKLWSVRPYFQYFIKSNISVGLRLGYTQGRANIGSFNVDIDDDMSFNLHDIMYKSNNYSASLTFSQYLGITRKGRFGVFNEVELAFAGGDSDFHRPYNGEMRRTHTTTFQAALNFSPGVCVYVIDQLSFNVSLGVFGLNIKHEKQKVNDEELGWRTTSGANFRFNIFNINFGIAVNI